MPNDAEHGGRVHHDDSAAFNLPHLVRDLGGWRPIWGTWAISQYVPALIIYPFVIWRFADWSRLVHNIGGTVLLGVAIAVLALGPLALGYFIGRATFDGRAPTLALRALASGAWHETRTSGSRGISQRGRRAEVTVLPPLAAREPAPAQRN